MKQILLWVSLLTLLNSCSSVIVLKNPSFEQYYINPSLEEAPSNQLVPLIIGFEIEKEEQDTLLYEESVIKWFDKYKVDIKAMSFHDGYTMLPMKKLGTTITWASEFKTHSIKKKTYHLSHVVEQEHVVHFFYGSAPNEFHVVEHTSILVIRDKKSKKIKATFDFSPFSYPPKFAPKVKGFVFQNTLWAHEELGVLYVCHSHNTYANSSEGMNAYITAIDWRKKKILWRSQPLVSNAINFIVKGSYLITGYGFTREGAKLYALDKKNGKIRGEVELAASKTGKKHLEFLYNKGENIYIKAFDNTEYKVSIK